MKEVIARLVITLFFLLVGTVVVKGGEKETPLTPAPVAEVTIVKKTASEAEVRISRQDVVKYKQ